MSLVVESWADTEQTYQSPKIVPNFGDVGVQSNRAGIRIQSITILVDLVIQNADRAPECRIAPVSVDCLLIGFISFGVFLLRHVASPQEIPALRIRLIWDHVSFVARQDLVISYLIRRIFQDILSHVLGYRRPSFLGDAASQAAAKPLHGSGLAPALVGRRFWQPHTECRHQ